MVFWWLNLVRLYSLCKILYPKRRIESYSIMGTIVSPTKILLMSSTPMQNCLIIVQLDYCSTGHSGEGFLLVAHEKSLTAIQHLKYSATM